MRTPIPIRFEPDPAFDSQRPRDGSAGSAESPPDAAREPQGWRIWAAGVAHEIRNPLAAVSNAVSLLRRRSELDAESRELLEMVLDEVRRIDRIADDFSNLVSPAADAWEDARLEPLLEGCVALARRDPRRAPEACIEGVCQKPLPRLRMQPDRIRQVLWNLILNALEAIGPAGRIRVEARAEERSGRAGVGVSVCDDGPGVPPEARERVFEPFETRRGEGSGLGLAIARRIVERHQGQMGIDASPLGGARVWFWLPLAPARG